MLNNYSGWLNTTLHHFSISLSTMIMVIKPVEDLLSNTLLWNDNKKHIFFHIQVSCRLKRTHRIIHAWENTASPLVHCQKTWYAVFSGIYELLLPFCLNFASCLCYNMYFNPVWHFFWIVLSWTLFIPQRCTAKLIYVWSVALVFVLNKDSSIWCLS